MASRPLKRRDCLRAFDLGKIAIESKNCFDPQLWRQGMFGGTKIFEGVGDVAKSRFFEERTDQSEVKARIVQKYFYAWAKVIMPTAKQFDNKIAYIDLYAGPGRYRDGAASTPLLVLEHAIADPKLSEMLVALFNDADENHSETLMEEIKKLPGIEGLKHQPEVLCGPVDEDAEYYFTQTRLIPSFTFVDPFGYKGLSLRIVNGVIKDWGSK